MPQLDRVIIFTQLLWLFITFSVTYMILVIFFLPSLVKLLKTRNLFTQIISEEVNKLQSTFYLDQYSVIKILHKSLVVLKRFLQLRSSVLFSKKLDSFTSLDFQLFVFISYIMLYYNRLLLNLIPFRLKNSDFMRSNK